MGQCEAQYSPQSLPLKETNEWNYVPVKVEVEEELVIECPGYT